MRISLRSDIPGQGITRTWLRDDGSQGGVAIRVKRQRDAGSWGWAATDPEGNEIDSGSHPNKETATGQATSALIDALANRIPVQGSLKVTELSAKAAFETLAAVPASELRGVFANDPDTVGKVKRRLAQVK